MDKIIQRKKFQNSRKLNLTGTLYKDNSDTIVVMAHGFIRDSRRFEYIAQCLNASGYNVFTFDFSGCGESDNDKLTGAKQVDDLQSAIAYVLG
jgi:alpha-beta hydrolase superfamily lysophospholipase